MPAAAFDLNPLLPDYPRRFCSVCGQVVRKRFKPGPGGRPDASCPRCRSLERHRFFAILLDVLRPLLRDLDLLLEVAPSPETSPLLARLEAHRHVRLDLGADNRLVDVLGSVTALPFADDSVDLIVCYHVLEHVPDDRAAMREIARVLAPGGLGLVQVPYRPGTVTDEDPSAGEEERIRRFGQADHVRFYGRDFEERMVEAGLSLQRVTPRAVLGADMAVWLHLNPVEMVWIVRARPGAAKPAPYVERATSLTRTLDAMLGEMTRLRADLIAERARAGGLEQELSGLRDDAAASPWTRVGRRARRQAGRVRRGAGRVVGRARISVRHGRDGRDEEAR